MRSGTENRVKPVPPFPPAAASAAVVVEAAWNVRDTKPNNMPTTNNRRFPNSTKPESTGTITIIL